MIFHDFPQGSEEWLQARSGSITASTFADAIAMVGGLTEQQQKYVDAIRSGKDEDAARDAGGYKTKVKRTESVERAIIGQPVGEFSDGSKKLAGDIAIERISGKPYGAPPKAWVLERGHIMEVQARMAYEMRTGLLAQESGLCKTDDDWFGYSTDGLVGDDGLIEIKCPIDSNKIAEMLKTGDVSEYIHQMQGGMWITGRKWCDFIMYVPDLERVGNDLYIKRIHRDDNFIDSMVDQLMKFRESVQMRQSLFSKPLTEQQEASWQTPTQ